MSSQDIATVIGSWRNTPYAYGGDSHSGIDCSHFVWEVLKASGHPNAAYVRATDLLSSHHYSRVTGEPSVGDIVHFNANPAHMGIIVDAHGGHFVGAQSHGVGEASYTSGYWSHMHPSFWRYTGP